VKIQLIGNDVNSTVRRHSSTALASGWASKSQFLMFPTPSRGFIRIQAKNLQLLIFTGFLPLRRHFGGFTSVK
jgi:hypothetical protein